MNGLVSASDAAPGRLKRIEIAVPNSVRTGLTLIEVMAATVLVSLLMAALCGVINGLHNQRQALAGAESEPEWRFRIEKQVAWDLENARRIHVQDDRLTLVGYGGRNFKTGEPTHRPTEVVYSVVPANGEQWLVRREFHLDEQTNRNSNVDLIAGSIAEIRVGKPDESVANYVPSIAGAGLSPVPARIRCVMRSKAGAVIADVVVIQSSH